MDAAISEFPFAATLPKREKGKLAKLLDLLEEMKCIQSTEGTLIPLRMAAKVMGVSRQRVEALIEDGRVRRFDVDGHPFVTENSVVSFCRSERKNGRPVSLPGTWTESRNRARQYLAVK